MDVPEEHIDNLCPRCKKGVLIQRNGKNGLFWGCSNYPTCRMTCNDKDGKPDLEDAKARVSRRRTSGFSGFAGRQNTAGMTPQGGQEYAPSFGGSSQPTAAEMAEIESLLSADYASFEQDMAESMKNYQSTGRKSTWQNWADKPKYSASPLEHMEESAVAQNTAESHACPRCQSPLRQIRGRNGTFWGCTNYPRCTATFDDKDGTPVINT